MTIKGKRNRKRASRWLMAFTVATAVAMVAEPATARKLEIEQFEARIVVANNGTIEATETIRARFVGAWQGLYRTIPVEYRTPQGLSFTLSLDVLRITDGDGNPLTYEATRERHQRKFRVFLPGATDASKTVVITYRAANALRFFDDHDELYWNITGDQWDVPINNASAHIDLPAGVTGLRATDFTGGFGSRAQNADLQVQATSVDLHTTRRLGFHEGLTVIVGWDKGFVHEPTAVEKTVLFLRSNWPLSLPVIPLIIVACLWFARGRDPRLRPIAVRYQPPEGLTPAEAGTLLDDSVDMRDITATIVDLAVRGFLVIEERKSAGILSVLSGPEYVFHLRKKPEQWSALKPHERQLLTGIFSGGARETVSISDLENVFYTNLPGIKSSIFESLMESRFYLHRPDEVRNRYIIAGILTGVALVAGGLLATFKLGMSPVPFLVAAAASAAIVCAFARVMPTRTERGARVLEDLIGFEKFLSDVEEGRSQTMMKTPEMFDTFLPFAMALGVEKRWVKAFEVIYVRPSHWYLGLQGPDFRLYDFAGNLNRMTGHVGATLGSTPRSSGGSGFGAGRSGGGAGGGGGGGF
jgi:uncharacterized membrane protein YgcG